jgi:large subunit ribosomal protein L29
MKAEQIRDLETTELERQLKETTGQLFHLRFQMRMGQMEGLKKYRGLRKDRARIETVLSARRAAAESQKG